MDKRIILLIVGLWLTGGSASAKNTPDPNLEESCLGCHQEQKLPDNLIYRRYLLKYSSPKRIEKALVSYLRHPSQQTSIMPAEFFLRFPMRDPVRLDEATLHDRVRRYIDYFDVRKRLRREKKN